MPKAEQQNRPPVLLPNKDLWTGFDPNAGVGEEETFTKDPAKGDPMTEALTARFRMRDGVKDPYYVCPYDGEEFSSEDNIRHHMIQQHSRAIRQHEEHAREDDMLRELEELKARTGETGELDRLLAAQRGEG